MPNVFKTRQAYRPPRKKPSRRNYPSTSEMEYDAEESELLAAADAYRQEHGIRFLTVCEMLKVAKSVGWRKVE